MEITNRELDNIYHALIECENATIKEPAGLPIVKFRYRCAKMLRQIKNSVEVFYQQKEQLQKLHADKDESGEIIFTDKSNRFIKMSDQESFAKDYGLLCDETCKVEPLKFKLDEIPNDVPASFTSALFDFIEE